MPDTNDNGAASQPSLADLMSAITQVSSQLGEMRQSMSEGQETARKKNEQIENHLKVHDQKFDRYYKIDIKRNIVIYGWTEMQNQPLFVIRQKLLELLKDKLEIKDVRSFDIHALNKRGDKKNVIIATLCSPELVQQAVRNSAKLAGTKIFIDYDLAPAERKNKRELLMYKKNLAARDKECRLKGRNILMVDDEAFSLQQLQLKYGVLNMDAEGAAVAQIQCVSNAQIEEIDTDFDMSDAVKKRTPPERVEMQTPKKQLILKQPKLSTANFPKVPAQKKTG